MSHNCITRRLYGGRTMLSPSAYSPISFFSFLSAGLPEKPS